MKRVTPIMFVVTILSLIGSTGASTQTGSPTRQKTTVPRPQITLEKTTTTQQRLNRYFHADVIPKLKNCWSSVQGKGSIALEHNYKKGPDGRWAPTGVALIKSALPRGQEAIALRCMQGATRGTSFPAEGSDAATTYTIKWTWPVPFPTNAQLTSAMFAARANNGGADGGCDGRGAPAACYNCSVSGGSLSCKSVCVGYKECKLTLKQGYKVCEADGSGDCASGGPFGVSGSRVIY